MSTKTPIKLGLLMDPLENIRVDHDTTLAFGLAAQARGWEVYYLQQHDLSLVNHTVHACLHRVKLANHPTQWFEITDTLEAPLQHLDVLLMRKDPPFDMEYIYTTYLLELAEKQGVWVINHPASLRDANEKLFTAWFPQCIPPTIVTRSLERLRNFLEEHQDIIVKPLHGMGGTSIFRLRPEDPNINAILEHMTAHQTTFTMAQRYLPEIVQGDKRILMIFGEPSPYSLARMPKAGETRANLAAGGRGISMPLTPREYWLCEQVSDTLVKKGLHFVGLDVIGDYITEINVTSPTCLRELEKQQPGLNLADQFLDKIAKQLQFRTAAN